MKTNEMALTVLTPLKKITFKGCSSCFDLLKVKLNS